MGPISKEPEFVIHHLTDIHIGKLQFAPEQKLRMAPAPSNSRNLDLYLDSLERTRAELLPDLVIASGDFTCFASVKEMDTAQDKLRKILEILEKKPSPWRENAEAPFVLIVPGNHDLDWSEDSHAQKIERYARMADSLYQGGKILSSTYHSAPHATSWDFGEGANLFVGLFDSTALGGTRDSVLVEIYKRLAERYRAVRSSTADAEVQEALDALFKEARKDPGYVEPAQLEAMAERVAGLAPNRIKIAVMHHNPTTVPADDLETFDVVVNAGIVKRELAAAGFDLVLYGHRHVFHCCREHIPFGSGALKQELRFVSGDSIGCKADAPFVEIRLQSMPRAHAESPPACFLSVSETSLKGGAYAAATPPALQGILSRPLNRFWDSVAEGFGPQEMPASREDMLRAIAVLLPQLQHLQSKLVDWDDDSGDWISRFHIQLGLYRRIYATDIYRRPSTASPNFEKYLREQYIQRLRGARSCNTRKLSFSPPVYEAIIRTGWQPSPVLWSDYRLERGEGPALEIVRILVRPPDTSRDRKILEALDFDHRLFAIPLFVIDPADMSEKEMVDFAIGFGKAGEILKAYEYVPSRGKVGEAELRRARDLRDTFEGILKRRELQTVSEWLGYYDGMIRDPNELRKFAETYDQTRTANATVLSLLTKHLGPGPHKTGLDIGCGTGNYTIPLAREFGRVIGLDISDEMLTVARRKSSAVTWICANALNNRLPDASCDAVWLIASLHYFQGAERQKLLFKEIYRLLKPGGVVLADTEFAEQHSSLWVTKFFPSLIDRYKNAIFSSATYERGLRGIGYTAVHFETLRDIGNDAGIRFGHHHPERYLDSELRAGVPAFHEMDPDELDRGLTELEHAIDDGSIAGIIRDYEARATMAGDVGFLIARR